MSIHLTESAASRARKFIDASPGALGLRFGVRRTGCSGWAYVVVVADAIAAGDRVFEDQGVRIVVDADSLPLSMAPRSTSSRRVSTQPSLSAIPTSPGPAAAARASPSAERFRSPAVAAQRRLAALVLDSSWRRAGIGSPRHRWRTHGDHCCQRDEFHARQGLYPRSIDDDAGFAADLPANAVGHLGMRAKLLLSEPVISESTTFWKATYGKPTDFTLKKRYFVGTLEEILFVDLESGAVLCVISPGHSGCRRR